VRETLLACMFELESLNEVFGEAQIATTINQMAHSFRAGEGPTTSMEIEKQSGGGGGEDPAGEYKVIFN
jgi:hypothetical protein